MEDEIRFARALRNKVAQGEVVKLEEIYRAAELVTSSSKEGRGEEGQVLALCIQFLANISVTESAQQRLCWKAFYPKAVLDASLSRNSRVLDPLCYALWNYAKLGLYTLLGEGRAIFDNLTNFYIVEWTGSQTCFSLLVGELLHLRSPDLLDCPTMLSALGKIDIGCFHQNVIRRLLESLLERAKLNDSHEVLFALRNCVLAGDSETGTLTDIMSWALGHLSNARADTKARTGLQTDVIALLCNLFHQREELQEAFVDAKGMELILNSIRLDDANPYIREWALLCIRNLCMENKRAQDLVRSLELKEVVTDDILGADIEFDKMSGTFRARKR